MITDPDDPDPIADPPIEDDPEPDPLPPEDSAEADELASFAEGEFTRWVFREDY